MDFNLTNLRVDFSYAKLYNYDISLTFSLFFDKEVSFMPTYKHLTLNERISIEHSLKKSYSFKAIAHELNRDCTTISKEIKNHSSRSISNFSRQVDVSSRKKILKLLITLK